MLTTEQEKDRYMKAAHAMQSGVAYRHNKDDQTPKHLRVGVNAAMSDTRGLAKLLIDKGIFTELEYYTALADSMEREVKDYETLLTEEMHASVKLR